MAIHRGLLRVLVLMMVPVVAVIGSPFIKAYISSTQGIAKGKQDACDRPRGFVTTG